ncbi:hypothetical protein EYF80_040505 [Liparis tanakae]|uniref:Uncharacterized protein n=1 Tax=Liparis tanakae TaxID=230148 RepID=A0A4Z2G855_9TELE|nr:hypothetical protein EYF80_040505 [Liparis tanakae]
MTLLHHPPDTCSIFVSGLQDSVSEEDKDSSLRRGCVESDSSLNKMTASGYTRLYSGNTDCFIGNKSSVTSWQGAGHVALHAAQQSQAEAGSVRDPEQNLASHPRPGRAPQGVVGVDVHRGARQRLAGHQVPHQDLQGKLGLWGESAFPLRLSRGGAEESSRGARCGGGRVSDRDRGAIVPGRGGGGRGQAAALLRGSHRPMQARNQKQRRQKAQQRRGAFSSGHGETGSGPKDITNQGPARDQKNEAVCVLITKAASLSWFLVMLVLTEVGGGRRGEEGGKPCGEKMRWC